MEKLKGYVSLHTHSNTSFLDSICSPRDLVETAKGLGQPAVAVSDHGNMHNYIQLYKIANEEGVKPIIGIEFYIAPDMHEKETTRYHLLVLAKNKTGLKNLIKLISKASVDGFYYKPRIEYFLLKNNKEGLIVSTACMQGEIPQAILEDNIEQAENLIDQYKSDFGDDFYLEIMPNPDEDQKKINDNLIALSDKKGVDLLATNDVHYMRPEDFKDHDVYLAVGTKDIVDDPDRKIKFDHNIFYMMDDKEMLKQLKNCEVPEEIAIKAINNTVKVADKIEDYNIEFGNLKLPVYDVPEGKTLSEHLEDMCYEKLFALSLQKNIDLRKYSKRLQHELDIIDMKGYPGYFLIVQDFVNYAKNNDILVGPGRGSAAGSLVSYLLNITAVDPIEHDLIFSRFLNPERESMPDIDIDFLQNPTEEVYGRDKVIEYVVDKYGRDHVAQICTFGSMATKAALKDFGRALDIDYEVINKEISPLVPNGTENIDEALNNSQELKVYEDKYPRLFELVRNLEGSPRHLGRHASAIIITPEPVEEYVPLAKAKGEIVTQTEMHDTEDLGLLKMDFLGLKTLNLIDSTLQHVHRRDDLDNKSLIPTTDNIWNLPKDDINVYKTIFQTGDTSGVFQVESQLFKGLLSKMKPTEFEHIIAILALGRPGPLDSGIVDDYINRMHGQQQVEYPDPSLKPVLEETYGLMIYQENILKVAREFAGYSLGEADVLRRGIGKKIESVLAEQQEKFVQGAMDKGYTKEKAEDMFETIEYFSGYGFNKSHSCSYAYIAWATAWLKTYYPVEFYASLLTQEARKSPRESTIRQYIAECYERNIELLPPDINISGASFTPDNKTIRFGLESINGLGPAAIEDILAKRPFYSFEDLYKKVDHHKVNKGPVEALIESGALDRFGKNRNQLKMDYHELRKFGEIRPKLFDDSQQTTKKEVIKMEIERLSMSVTNPSDWLITPNHGKYASKGKVESFREITTKNGNLMGFADLDVGNDLLNVVVFPSIYKKCHDILKRGNTIEVKGKKEDNSLILDEIELVEGEYKVAK